MATYEKHFLSGSTSGESITLSGSAISVGTAQVVHTATAVAGQIDEIWIYITIAAGASVVLNFIYGTGAADWATGAAGVGEPRLMIPGLILADGETVSIFGTGGSPSDQVRIMGYINRIIP